MRILTILFFICGSVVLPVGAIAEQGRTSVNIVIDNGGTLLNADEARPFTLSLLDRAAAWRKRPETSGFLVNILTLNDPRNVFVGGPRDLYRGAGDVMAAIERVPNGCMDLVRAIDQIRLNVEQQRPDRVEIHVVSSMIATGSPCDGTITLPHPMPEDLDFSFLDDVEHRVRLFWVHHHQIPGVLDAFRDSGLVDYRIHDEATSKTILRDGGFD